MTSSFRPGFAACLDKLSRILRRVVTLILLVLMAAPMLTASSKISLNGPWQFRLDPQNQGEQQAWTSRAPSDTETVNVPHTWNVGKYDDYEGTAWYFLTLTLPPDARGKHVELHFGATFYKSRVWLNGAELGGHEGGHTEYWFDVTPQLADTNYLAVEINNQPGVDTIPGWAMDLKEGGNIWYDWWHYGGIVRDVWLAVSDATLIRRQFIRTKVDGKVASITDRVYLENHSHRPIDAKVILKAWSPEGGSSPAATAQQNVKLTPGKQDLAVALRIDSARLWDFDHPNVYLMQVDLVDAKGNTLDSITDNFGVRTVELRDSKLWLNGEAVRLSGMARHEESPWEGLAETRGTILHDWDDMKNLQMTLARPVHYPQHPLILDYADRHGIMLIPEIPIWHFTGEQLESPKVQNLARQMMQEMIEQAGNHPSIWAWSTCNESSTNTPGGRAYFKMMYDFIKSLDPDRYVSYADDRIAFTDNPQDNSAGQADFIMWNEYFGAWHGPTSMLPAVFERIRKGYPGKMVIVSEFGTPGLFAPNSKEGDKLRARIYREQMAKFGKQDWISER